jgi:hypothetical protein
MTCFCVEFYVISVLGKALCSRLFKRQKSVAGVEDDSDYKEDEDYEYESESDNSSDDSSVESNSDSDSDFDSDDKSLPELVRRMVRDDSSWCSSSESESSSEDEDDDDDFFNSIDRIDRDEVYDILMESKSYERDERASNTIGSTNEVETVQEETTEEHNEDPAAERAGVAVSNTNSQGTYESQKSTREQREPTRYDPAKGLTQMIATKKVKFKAQDILEDLEHCHNMIGRAPGEMIKYKTVIAGVAARHIHNHNERRL